MVSEVEDNEEEHNNKLKDMWIFNSGATPHMKNDPYRLYDIKECLGCVEYGKSDSWSISKIKGSLDVKVENKNGFINISPDAASWRGKKGYDKNMGARPLSRLIQEKVKKPIAEEILYGVLEKGGTVNVSLKKDKLNFVYKPLKKNNKIKKELLKS